jgi:hypothetical protein
VLVVVVVVVVVVEVVVVVPSIPGPCRVRSRVARDTQLFYSTTGCRNDTGDGGGALPSGHDAAARCGEY